MIDLTSFWQPFALVVVAGLISFVAATYFARRNREDAAATRADIAKALALEIATATTTSMRKEIEDLKRQIDVLNIPVQQLNTAFQAILVRQLTHFHTKELDDLLAKLGPPLILTKEEADRLIILLKEREVVIDNEISDSERDAAHMLPMVMKRVLSDLEQPNLYKTDLIVVAVPKVASEDNLAPPK